MLPHIDRTNMGFANSDGIFNIGFAEGTLSDGRPYRAELYSVDHVMQLSVFLSTIGIGHNNAATITDYLTGEGLFELYTDRVCEIRELTDKNDNSFFEAVIVLGVEDELYGNTHLQFSPFPYVSKRRVEDVLKKYMNQNVIIKKPGQENRIGQVIGYNSKEDFSYLIVLFADKGKPESLRVGLDEVEFE